MESDPGLGKSLLATVFIKESGRKSLVFRKTSQENSFLDELRAAFLAAKEAAPSILLLEDLNLYVESNSPMRQNGLAYKPVLTMQEHRHFCDCYNK